MKKFVLYLLLVLALPVTALSQYNPGPLIKVGRHAHPAPPQEPPGMNSKDYEDAVKIISKENFDDKRLAAAQRIIEVNPMNADQIAGVCRLFNFEANKLEFAKFAYRYCVDPNRYFVLDEVFTFESSKEELHEFIRNW